MNWSYIACFIDTDGSIGFRTDKYADGTIGYSIQVRFINTNLEALSEIQKFVRGRGVVRTRQPSDNPPLQKKISYTLSYTKLLDVFWILHNVKDEMIIKRDKAERAYRILINKHKKRRLEIRCRKPYPEWFLEITNGRIISSNFVDNLLSEETVEDFVSLCWHCHIALHNLAKNGELNLETFLRLRKILRT